MRPPTGPPPAPDDSTAQDRDGGAGHAATGGGGRGEGPRRPPQARRVLAHLVAVGTAGLVVTVVELQAEMIALFAGERAMVLTLAALGPLAVAALTSLRGSVREVVPFTRGGPGLWVWAASVWGLATAGTCAAVVVDYGPDGLTGVLPLWACGGVCHALAAAFFVPGPRTRLTALGTAVLLACGGAYADRAASQPPTLDEWISANGVDRGMLRVGDRPAGYSLRVLGASEDGFGADYERPGTQGLHLGVAREGSDTVRVDAHGCPVPFGDPVHCADDGGGRLLVVHEGDYPYQELRLRRGGLVYTVTVRDTPPDLAAARHVLSTLRPASAAELAGLVDLPMRR